MGYPDGWIEKNCAHKTFFWPFWGHYYQSEHYIAMLWITGGSSTCHNSDPCLSGFQTDQLGVWLVLTPWLDAQHSGAMCTVVPQITCWGLVHDISWLDPASVGWKHELNLSILSPNTVVVMYNNNADAFMVVLVDCMAYAKSALYIA